MLNKISFKLVKGLKINKKLYNPTISYFSSQDSETIQTDVVIVGGGPAGLSTAIKLKQLAKLNNQEIDVTLVEKGAEIGSHILSGNCFESQAMTELIPNWREKSAPINTKVTQDKFLILTKNSSINIPEFLIPKSISNHGNYIISLSEVCRWLGKEAEELGVNIFTGFAADNVTMENGRITGIKTGDFGINKLGKKKDNYQVGVGIQAKITVLAEGCRGSISEKIMNQFNLRSFPNKYGLGLKEVWEVKKENKYFKPGLVQHTVYWPLSNKEYGGSFMYHMEPNLIQIGFVVGLDYKNPHINLYEEFQNFKTHKEIRKYLEEAKCISYGARALNSLGYYGMPNKLSFPGGLFVGCSAGMMNVSKIKGSHNAIRSGIIAAEVISEEFSKGNIEIGRHYDERIKNSKIIEELYTSRNFKGGFKFGLFTGLAHSFFTGLIGGKEPWNLQTSKKDSEYLEPATKHIVKEYPKHDGNLTFDLLENLSRSGTNHEHDQPSHLKIKPQFKESNQKSLKIYNAPEEKFCPAKVYEFVEEKGEKRLQINAQNCLHCKCCSIKMIDEYIDWTVPEGSGGPKYNLM